MNEYLPPAFVIALQNAEQRFRWRGVRCVKNPFDMQIMSMLLWREKPKTIIEVGSCDGGSALWMRDIMLLHGVECRILSVDLKPPAVTAEGVGFLEGDGRDLAAVFSDRFMAEIARPLLIVEDADHSEETTSAVLQFWMRWAQPYEMIVIEDGTPCPGPHAAVTKFMNEHGGEAVIDYSYCNFFGPNLTLFRDGYIRRA